MSLEAETMFACNIVTLFFCCQPIVLLWQEVAELRGSQERARIGEGFFTVLDKVNIIHTESRVGHTSLPTSGQLAVTVVSPMFYVDPYPIFQLSAILVLGLIKKII